MSAAAAWGVGSASTLVSPSRRRGARATGSSRPQLRLVPTGDQVRSRPLRLSRWGRLAVTLTVAAAVATLALVMIAGAGAAPLTIDHATSVRPGQTLSEVAATQLPQLPVAEAVAQIQLANDLSSAQVHAGQTLLIPAVR